MPNFFTDEPPDLLDEGELNAARKLRHKFATHLLLKERTRIAAEAARLKVY
jgi:hypothetical protein